MNHRGGSMKKSTEIIQHINLVDEAFFLLYQWVNNNDLGEIKLRNAEEMHLGIEVYKRRFEILNNIFHDVTEQLKGKKDRIEYYFKERNNEFSNLAALALLWEVHRLDNKLLPYEEQFMDIDDTKRIKEFASIISDEEAENTPDEKLRNQTDLIRFVEDSPYDNEAKWEVIKIFTNQEASYNEVCTILQEVIEIFTGKYSRQIAELEQECYEYWSSFQKENDIIETVNEKLKISWESDKETVILPLFFLPYGITFSVTDADYCSKDIVRISVMIDANFIITDRKITKEDVVNVGKLLSDKSKVDILEFISRKPCYGKEIANELNLSTATISYHVNALLQIRFIKADVNSNKVFYSIDRERISAYLDDVKDYFLNL
jgi:DNA-binding transcriptional ArsR family regulator